MDRQFSTIQGDMGIATSIEDEHEHFLHWLVGDHIPSKSPRSALIASPEKGDRLLQSKDASLCVQEYLDCSPNGKDWMTRTKGTSKAGFSMKPMGSKWTIFFTVSGHIVRPVILASSGLLSALNCWKTALT